MCGIFGYFDRTGQNLPEPFLRRMAAVLAHRGPDDEGLFIGEGVALGNNRLAIIDLDGGHQPVTSDDGNLVLVQNGEIYNYIELAAELKSLGVCCRTNSDTEVLLRLFESFGPEMLSKLNGMFALAIYDRRQRTLLLARDRVGVKPLYVADDGQRIVFASEIKSLFEAGVSRDVSLSAVDDFLALQFVPLPRTLYSQVTHLEPGHTLVVSPVETRKRRWWDLSAVEQCPTLTEGEALEEVSFLLRDSVRLRCRSDAPFGAFLSGGLDSSAVAWLMSAELSKPVRAFTIGFEGFSSDESESAAAFARRTSLDHRVHRTDDRLFDLWPQCIYQCDQPHGDASFLPTYALSRFAARDVKVVLTGDGADEVFGGYDRHVAMLARREHSVPEIYHQESAIFSGLERRALLADSVGSSAGGPNAFELIRSLAHRCREWDMATQYLYLDTMVLLPGNNLVKPDRMGMANSLEARDPYLDHRLVELAFRLPGHLKIGQGDTKYVLRKAMGNMLGNTVAGRPKRMFSTPLMEWFHRHGSATVRHVLLSDRCQRRGLLRPGAVLNFLDRAEPHTPASLRRLRCLYVFELWCRLFLDRLGPEEVLDEFARHRAVG